MVAADARSAQCFWRYAGAALGAGATSLCAVRIACGRRARAHVRLRAERRLFVCVVRHAVCYRGINSVAV